VEAGGGNLVTIDDVALRVSEARGAAGVPFMLVGGFSSNLHGIPRSTKDADFVRRTSSSGSCAGAGRKTAKMCAA